MCLNMIMHYNNFQMGKEEKIEVLNVLEFTRQVIKNVTKQKIWFLKELT